MQCKMTMAGSRAAAKTQNQKPKGSTIAASGNLSLSSSSRYHCVVINRGVRSPTFQAVSVPPTASVVVGAEAFSCVSN
jgi:hypothetical protein